MPVIYFSLTTIVTFPTVVHIGSGNKRFKHYPGTKVLGITL